MIVSAAVMSVNKNLSKGASTFTKGLKVLSCFENGLRSFSMADLAKVSGFDRATTRRLCLSLVESGFLQKFRGQLSLSPKVLSLAGAYLAVNDIGLSVQPVLDRFASELGSRISLAILDGDRAIYLAESSSGSVRLSFGFTVGSTLPLLHTSVGRMILAGCSDDEVDDLFDRLSPKPYTESTELDLAVIRNDLSDIAKVGFCFLENEFERGASALAVPVGLMSGRPAVVGITNTINRLSDEQERERSVDILRQTSMALRGLSIFSDQEK